YNNFFIIEKALSPVSGIPCKLIQNFLNQIINNVNFFISKVWSYPFQLLPLDDKQLDFQFSYLIGDEIVSDISKGSEAQKVMIDFAFTLAILVLKGWTNYPLFLDEIDKSFDETHKNHILELLEYLLNERIISQLFIVGHHNAFYSGFQNKKIIDMNNLES
ncbi:MAG: hypothetical protein LBE13_18020, partial [Bacteroidales bacterium]|nr:hypothetical protein [Bacteroidales bacterium]